MRTVLFTAALSALTISAGAATFTVETLAKDGIMYIDRVEVDAPQNAEVVRFTWPASRIRSGVKWIDVKADFSAAKAKECGYAVLAPGYLVGFVEGADAKFQPKQDMPFYGMKTEHGTFTAIVTGLPYSFKTVVERKKGAYCVYLRFDRDLDMADENVQVEYHFLRGGDADYSAIAREYRKYQLAHGCVPLVERMKKSPALTYIAKYPEIRVRNGWKPVPSPKPEQTVKDEPPVKPMVTFDRYRDIVRECRKQGLPGAEFTLVGWNVGGHDGRWPQIFPVEPMLGGEGKLKSAIAFAKENGYMTAAHCNHRDAYIIADGWDAEYIVERDADGKLQRPKTTWGGGRMYTLCPQRAYERFAIKDMPMVRAMGFEGVHYLDVFSCVPCPCCRNPNHRLSHRQAAKYIGHILELGRETFGGIASEGAFDHNAANLDAVLYASFDDPFAGYHAMVMKRVPIFEIVYHGILLSNPYTKTVNAPIRGRDYELKLAECGGHPVFYVYQNFKWSGKNWMGNEDLSVETDEKLSQTVSTIKRGYDEFARRADLESAFYDRHEEVLPKVTCSTYSNGAKVYVNYNDSEVKVGEITIAPKSVEVVR